MSFQNVDVEIPTPNVMVLRGMSFEGSKSFECGALVDEISVVVTEAPDPVLTLSVSLTLLSLSTTLEYSQKIAIGKPKRESSPRTQPWGHPDCTIPGGAVEINVCCL